MKNLSVKKIVTIIIAAVIAAIVIAVAAIMIFRIDEAEAKNIALKQAGGGEIISSETSKEALWSEYSFVISNGDQWYDIEVGGFGHISEIESGTGPYHNGF